MSVPAISLLSPSPAQSQRAPELATFEVVIQTYGTLLLRTARLLVDDEATAEDVVQNSLELAWRNLPSVRNWQAIKSWLIKIVTNQAISLRRHQAVSLAYLRRQQQEGQMELAALFGRETNGVQEQIWDLRAAIATLPIEQKVVIVLHYYLEMTVVESAAMLEISPNTVKKRLGTALRTLRHEMGEGASPAIAR